MKADETRSLSATGSSRVPSVVICPRFRAKYPSSKSVSEAARKIAAAIRTLYFVSNTATRSGTKKIRINVNPLGRFIRIFYYGNSGTDTEFLEEQKFGVCPRITHPEHQ